MDERVKIPKRIINTLLNSLSAGVVPRAGAPFIAIGRNEEIGTLLKDLEIVKDGGSSMRFIIGKYGSGKSFLIQLLRSHAIEKNYICIDADLSPERKICGSNGSGLATYRELIKNMSSKASPDGGALTQIISKWFSNLQIKIAEEGIDPDSPVFRKELNSRIYSFVRELEEKNGGFDFAKVLVKYYNAYMDEDEDRKSACMRWLRGEFNTKTEAKAALSVGSIIDDENWYEYIKLYSAFVTKIGYSGLVMFIDECVNLYKISNRISRENNYEKILSMFNDTLSGNAKGLMIICGGTPQFLEDQRRGLFSYEALRSRLADSNIIGAEFKNIMGPVIRLRRLSDNELFALMIRISNLHSQAYDYTPGISEEDMLKFLNVCLTRAGANIMITPREITRDFISLLNVMMQNKKATFEEVMGNSLKRISSAMRKEDDFFSDI
ncbi:MAG: biotin carboxylase [Ruminococcaceae bacterium]|nr:biotin carboxylase [Oscillospiraceae bacterium]